MPDDETQHLDRDTYAALQQKARDRATPSLKGDRGTNPSATGRHTRPDIFRTGNVLAGSYEILRVLGSGGMGQVFEARDLQLNRVVAIKAAWPEAEPDILRQEARALAAFRHPGLVGVHALGRHNERDFLVMEHLSGISLARHLEKRRESGGFGVDEALEILGSLCEALAVIHSAGLAHRDLKPDNVMLAPRGRVVLLDFGIVRLERHIADEHFIEGSPLYIAPESVQASVKVGEAHLVDLYALGVIAFEMLTGQPPFNGEKVMDIFLQHLNVPAPRLAAHRPEVPPALDALVAELLAKAPEDRPSSIESVTTALRSIRSSGLARSPEEELSVLIVDDDENVRDLLEMMVRREVPDAKIRCVANGEAALRVFHERPPSVMFLDLQMPVMNGVEVCMYLRGTNLAAHTTICVISGDADENQAILETLGVADIVAKNTDGPTALGARIRDVLLRVASSRRPRPSRSA